MPVGVNKVIPDQFQVSGRSCPETQANLVLVDRVKSHSAPQSPISFFPTSSRACAEIIAKFGFDLSQTVNAGRWTKSHSV